jgi:hypothetical protein
MVPTGESIDLDASVAEFPSELTETVARPVSPKKAPSGGGARRMSVLLVSAGSFVLGVAAGAVIVWLLVPSSGNAAVVATTTPPPFTVESPVADANTPAPPSAITATLEPSLPVSQASSTPPSTARARPKGFRGSLMVYSRPSGALVFLNGRAAGSTPLVLRNQVVGSRAVRIELDGYEAWTSAVRVVTNGSTSVRADLTARPR